MFAKLSNDNTNKKHILNPRLDWQNGNEANLHSSLISEVIHNHGIEVRYLRRYSENPDFVFGEDTSNSFEEAFKISVFLESFERYDGEGQLFTNFGYQMKDEVEFVININRFKEEADGEEPLEGDLIYIPMTNGLFEIKYINPEEYFYQFGNLPVRRLLLQKFTYSHETIGSEIVDDDENTIDIIEQLKDLNNFYESDNQDESRQVEEEDVFMEFNPNDPFGTGYGEIR